MQVCDIMDEMPLLTMSKSGFIDSKPELESQSEKLLETLSGLCSFHSAEDLSSLLFTDMFGLLVGESTPWIKFEVGLYKDHTKTIEIIPVKGSITIADAAISGGIPNNVVTSKNEQECASILQNWYNCVMTA